ncbi:hypothetical protein TOK_2193 [Pseudonocardia sp. N23]|nr:hypothetical protein TOK_2193 [Pseudonocardia sp. N23]
MGADDAGAAADVDECRLQPGDVPGRSQPVAQRDDGMGTSLQVSAALIGRLPSG